MKKLFFVLVFALVSIMAFSQSFSFTTGLYSLDFKVAVPVENEVLVVDDLLYTNIALYLPLSNILFVKGNFNGYMPTHSYSHIMPVGFMTTAGIGLAFEVANVNYRLGYEWGATGGVLASIFKTNEFVNAPIGFGFNNLYITAEWTW